MDPQVRAYLDQVAAAGIPPLEQLSVQQARANTEAAAPLLAGPPPPLHSVEDRVIAGVPSGVYAPESDRELPAVAYFHGGGWVFGSLETHEALCRRLAAAAGAEVVAVDYRMAPEHRFPAAVEDAWKVTSELAAGGRTVAVAGDSAGGNLAAVMAIKARDAGIGLSHQVLIYPVTDCDLDTDSYVANATGYGLTRAGMGWFWDHYVPDPAQRTHPDASPLRAESLARVAPATVAVCELDPLRDEGVAYAERLHAEGVPTRLLRYEGMIHGFARMFALIDRSHDLMAEVATGLKESFER
ncbi:MAG TPA: alpha/beta hydrolase [Candidatus Dormibacteraeota bacterium]